MPLTHKLAKAKELLRCALQLVSPLIAQPPIGPLNDKPKGSNAALTDPIQKGLYTKGLKQRPSQ